jgi:dolichol-phosphate mannosyltransferase
MISIIIPSYRCSKSLVELHQELVLSLKKLDQDFEIILVNDASPENDWEIITSLAAQHKNVVGIDLSRNFGQHYAISAGLDHAKGDWVVVMDGDLQDQPQEIIKLYNKALEGFDIVLARREIRNDSFLKRKGSQYFYKVLAYLTDTEQNAEVANFGIYKQNVIKSIQLLNDKIKYFPAMVKWVGYKRTEIIVEHNPRIHGNSSYSIRTLLRLAISVILSFSDKPLRLTVKLGLFLSGISFVFAIYILIKAITGQIEVIGYSSLIISIWFLSGMIITLLGMLGLYIGKIFDQVKNRPTYLIRELINHN